MKTTQFLARSAVAVGLLAQLGAASAQTVQLDEGLEVYWPFDEGEGNEALDGSGHDREATPAENLFPGATIDWSGGRFGGSVRFDRSYMIHSPFEYYGIGGAEPRTVSLWVKTTWDAANSSSLGALVGWGVNAPQQRIHVKLNGSTDADGNVLQHIRTENQGGNNFGDSIPLNDGVWRHLVSVFDPNVDTDGDGVPGNIGDFDHYVDGVLETKNGGLSNPVNTNINPDEGAVPLAVGGGYFPDINNARVSEARIDEFRLYSRALSVEEILALSRGEGVSGPPSVELLNEIEGAELWDAATPLEFTVTPQGSASVSADRFALSLNGRDVTSEAAITASGSGLSGEFGGLEVNKLYTGRISATDSQDRTYGFEFAFDTISLDNFTIEAEDFNFSGGAFFQDPIVCNIPGGFEDNCYFDRVSVPGVDANDDVLDDRPTDDDADYDAFLANGYRFGPGFFREEAVDTWVSGDFLRNRFVEAGPEFSDHDVERVSTGEWLNYTRDFEPDTYQIALRARTRAAQTLSLGTVSDPTSANQTVEPLGTFEAPNLGGRYAFVFLTDEQGRTATVELGGRQTLRLSAVEADGNIDLNYLMFIPAEPVTEPVDVTMQISHEAGQITIQWDGAGALQRAPSVLGPWENVNTAGNSFSAAPASTAEFFRVLLP